ncbi:MBL fold metallo-hydrolase [Paenibacillus chartarius]|uniref:MBL fold metallo-hydrolase n=1 Tax=Paenibacillus chartarius TaxID=747481 RepID=A0ABV6DKI3_9BACL
MTVRIQMIGTGSAFAKKYYNNNALVYGTNFNLLIDCGVTAPRSLHDLQFPLDRLDGILITHQHADHIGGLEEIALRLCYSYGRKRIKLFLPEALEKPLWNHSLRGGLENVVEGFHGLSDYFDVVLMKENVNTPIADNLTIELIRTDHIQQKFSCSLIINDLLFYTADIVFTPALLKRIVEERGCKYIFHDCQLSSPGIVHAALSELLTLPEELQERITLMHYGDDMDLNAETGRMKFAVQHCLYELV